MVQGMFPLRAFYWGQKGARDNFSVQIRNIVEEGYKSLGEKPVIIGECGVPMDLKWVAIASFPLCQVLTFFSSRRAAFESGDFTWQARMMDAMITALDRAMIGFTYVLVCSHYSQSHRSIQSMELQLVQQRHGGR